MLRSFIVVLVLLSALILAARASPRGCFFLASWALVAAHPQSSGMAARCFWPPTT